MRWRGGSARSGSASGLGRLQLLGAAVLFSTGGAAIKATDFGAWPVASFRSGIAALAVFALVRAARRLPDWRVLLVGAGYAATMILFVAANKLTTAANTIFLQSTAPLYILLFGPLILREPIRRADVVFIGVVAAGMLPFLVGVQDASATAPDPGRGNLVALASGVCWAATLMGMRWLARRGSGGEMAFATVFVGNALACLACLPFALPVVQATPVDWAVIVYLGLFQIALAYIWLTAGIRHVPALEASTILLVEPALNPLWAWALHDERPSAWAVLGGAVIIGATLVRTWRDGRPAATPARPVPERSSE